MNLTIQKLNEKFVVDSREVADMIGKRHSDLLQSIDGYIHHLENGKFRSQDFFVESNYKSEGNNKAYKCYLITKKGCDMVANKLTGEKGVLFTAAYVTKFEEMEKEIATYKPKMTSIGEVASLIKVLKSSMKDQGSAPSDITEMEKMICDQFNIKLPDKFVKKPKYVQIMMIPVDQ